MILQVQVSIVDGGGTRNSTFFATFFSTAFWGFNHHFQGGLKDGW